MFQYKQLRIFSASMLALLFAAIFPTAASAGWHTVEDGETLWVIGEQYGVDASTIAQENGIDNLNVIFAGQQLWIPDESGQATGGAAVIHIVVDGENLGSIAASYGITAADLAALNNIHDPHLIYPGQEITVPYAELPISPSPGGSINHDVPYYDHATIRDSIIVLADAYGWDAYLILSLAWKESTWDQRALSPAGAVGVMQLMPATADWAGPALVGRYGDYVNVAWDNIETGIAYLTHLRSLAGSDYLALAAYFQGLASVERDGIFPSTRAYALDIIESRDLFANGALP